jgi:acyl carrier protein
MVDIAGVRGIVAEVLEVEEDEVTNATNFMKDLGADSLRAVEILSRLEKRYRVVIPQEKLARMTCLNEICQVLHECEHASA